MARTTITLATLLLLLPAADRARAGREASFGGMTLVPLTEAQLARVEEGYGEPCGVCVRAVAPGSLAGRTGVRPGDFLISVRMPEESDFYPIPPDFDDLAAFCDETTATARMRLLLLRRVSGEWKLIRCRLGTPMDGSAGAEPAPEEESPGLPENCAVNASGFSFASKEPDAVLAKALDGSPLRQKDVDLYGGAVAWAFGARLTEAQKLVVRECLVDYWPKADAAAVANFERGVRQLPAMLPELSSAERAQLRSQFQRTLLLLASTSPDHPMSRIIRVVSANVRNILAGAGTEAELSQQDVDALLEYLAFRTRIQTGRPVQITLEQRAAFTRMVVSRYARAAPAERRQLSLMDEEWGRLRAAWAFAEAARRQELERQWRQAYARQAAAGRPPYSAGWYQAPGGQMSQGSFDAVMSSLRSTHEASMQAIGSIDGTRDTSVYDSAGNWMYDY